MVLSFCRTLSFLLPHGPFLTVLPILCTRSGVFRIVSVYFQLRLMRITSTATASLSGQRDTLLAYTTTLRVSPICI